MNSHGLAFGAVMLAAWALGTSLFIYFRAPLTAMVFKQELLRHGLGGVLVNTLYAVPELASPTATGSFLLRTGANRDTLYIGGWLDLRPGAQVLHVPAMLDRYYSVQFTDPADGSNFAYVGTRATGSAAGDYVLTGPGWAGPVPPGLQQIAAPNPAVLVIGRVRAEDDADVPAAYGLAKQIQLTPLSQWPPAS